MSPQLTAFLTLSPKGAIKHVETAETVIRSKRRFTYEDVQRILDGDKNARAGESAEILTMLEALHTLTTMLTKKRMREGSIDFDSAEAEFSFDAEGNPAAIHRKKRLDSHRLVEGEELPGHAEAVLEQNMDPRAYRLAWGHQIPQEEGNRGVESCWRAK